MPSLPSRWFKRTEAAAPASPPVTDNHHGAGAEGAAGVAGRSENFLLDTGATYSVLISSSEPSPPKPVPFWVLQEKQLLKDSPEHFFVAGMDKYFPTSFWWSLSVLLPYWEEIYSLVMGSFSAPRALQLLVTTEEPITPSIERDQKLWEDKINPQVWDQRTPG